jgi:CRP/FNR family transcriptional regulator, cyclic AMP receptor protein
MIMKEGDAGKNMYVLIKGKVAVSIQGKAIERVGPGGVFGEMALVDQGTRAASATAATDCQLLTITRPDFLDLVKSKPGFAVSLLKAIAERLRHMTLQKK